MNLLRFASFVMLSTLLASLSGCGNSGMDEVKQWMAKVSAQNHPSIPKLSEPKKFIPYTYPEKEETDPFSQSKLAEALAKQHASSQNGVAPKQHKPQPLESFPLDTITMVGSINKGGQHAILRVGTMLFNVKVGDYLGQNYGEITAITDTEVSITERVQDASDEWVERKTTLELQETSK